MTLDLPSPAVLAGVASTVLFVCSTLPMLVWFLRYGGRGWVPQQKEA